jgi:hypothetical protein
MDWQRWTRLAEALPDYRVTRSGVFSRSETMPIGQMIEEILDALSIEDLDPIEMVITTINTVVGEADIIFIHITRVNP